VAWLLERVPHRQLHHAGGHDQSLETDDRTFWVENSQKSPAEPKKTPVFLPLSRRRHPDPCFRWLRPGGCPRPSAPRGGGRFGRSRGGRRPRRPADISRFRRYASRIIALRNWNSPLLMSQPTLPFLEFFVTFPEFSVTNFEFFVTVLGVNPYSTGLSLPQVTILNSNSSLPPSARPGGSRGFPV
jgi:hypothetical protein